MTPRERAERALEEIHRRHWTTEATVEVIEAEIATAVLNERRACSWMVLRLGRNRGVSDIAAAIWNKGTTTGR